MTDEYPINDRIGNICPDELLKDADDPTSRMNHPEAAPSLCTALQVALFHQFQRIGMAPEAVIGHSTGEIAAAYAAGHLSLENAMSAAYYYGYVTRHNRDGGMAAVSLGTQEVQDFLVDGVVVACENSPSNTTLSGDINVLEQVLASVKAARPKASARLLRVDVAYHSRRCTNTV